MVLHWIRSVHQVYSRIRARRRPQPVVLLPELHREPLAGSQVGDDRQSHHILLRDVRSAQQRHYQRRARRSLRQLCLTGNKL